MNKLKKERGITLVALIITIVVLLILAIVSIGAVQDSNIIAHAENAAIGYQEGKDKENNTIIDMESLLEKYSTGEKKEGWVLQTDGETVKNSKTGETKKIGDTLTNAEVLAATGGTQKSYTGTWTILGAEEGQLKLVSTTNVTTTDVYLGNNDEKAPTNLDEIYNYQGEDNLNLEKAIWSYKNVENTLNEYAKDLTGITSARSIKVEDIETVCNITNDKKLESTNNDYGKEYTYSYNNGARGVYVNKEGETVVLDTENEEVKLNYTSYGYMNAFADTKFANSLGVGNYWLASPRVTCSTDIVNFRVLFVDTGCIFDYTLIISNGYATNISLGVRAIVYI